MLGTLATLPIKVPQVRPKSLTPPSPRSEQQPISLQRSTLPPQNSPCSPPNGQSHASPTSSCFLPSYFPHSGTSCLPPGEPCLPHSACFHPPYFHPSACFLPPYIHPSACFLPPYFHPSACFLPPYIHPSACFLPPYFHPSACFLPPYFHPSACFLPPYFHPSACFLTPYFHPSACFLPPYFHPSACFLPPYSHPTACFLPPHIPPSTGVASPLTSSLQHVSSPLVSPLQLVASAGPGVAFAIISEAVKTPSSTEVSPQTDLPTQEAPPTPKSPKSPPKSPKKDEDPEKVAFMVSLGLVTTEHLEEIQLKRQERKRRSTANPAYSGLFEPERKRLASHYLNSSLFLSARDSEDFCWKEDVEHEDVCAVCQEEGELQLCHVCPRAFHPTCLHPPLRTPPRGPWYCPKCQKKVLNKENMSWPQNFVQSYVTHKTVRQEEKRRLLRRNSELKKDAWSSESTSCCVSATPHRLCNASEI
ncbi:hypothetical protein JOQ06_006498 [Pogonophryne albipinna]|uniref:PHD-type domain-containing protein n=1 Tax=Pogonophryne albipinna TaxID=1090488 RepID=A0AAD6ACU6_9TELE|nr:hypothetical protein JOQ06_006498 [Pogonophryne albipinna]